MDINFMRLMFLFYSLLIIILGPLINNLHPYLPVLITRSFCYGKFTVKAHQPLVEKTEVPKRWFKHFYIFAAPSISYVLYFTYHKIFWNGNLPEHIHSILDLCLGKTRLPLVSLESTFVGITVLTIHVWKRLYESLYVSIFSDSMINISHYIFGFTHYIGVIVCVIGESKGFTKGSEATFSWERITFLHVILALITLLASYEQLRSNYILRNLRTNKDGVVVSTAYKIPYGRLFDYVSGALQFTEICIYICASIILWESSTFHYITLWVVSNQIETAYLTHAWYKKTFKDYPKTRHVVFPYLF